jgi:hypothetical protein
MTAVKTTEQEFKATMVSFGRSGMLQLLRAWGFTCHKTKNNAELAHQLWLLKQRNIRERAKEQRL